MALGIIFVKIGLRAQNFPVDEEKRAIYRYLVLHYGAKTLKELLLAFDLAITGKLTLKKEESVNCYENFTILYISSILNAYREWAQAAYKYIMAGAPEEPQAVWTEEMITNERREQIETAFQAMKKGYFPLTPEYFKHVLVADGLMAEDLPLADFFVIALKNPNIKNLYKKEDDADGK